MVMRLGILMGLTQVAVKLPDDLVRQVDELVDNGVFPSRSSVIRRGVETIVRAQRQHAVAEEYERGYRRFPESEPELVEATRLAVTAIHDEPWERWW